MSNQKMDILAIGAHPDDVELACSGTLMVHAARGAKIAVCDLTQGELGTRGNALTRREEAADAAKIMELDARVNLGMKDGFFRNDEEHQRQLIKVIRHFQPDIVLGNAQEDRHPDHGRAYQLIKDACFLAGLPKIETKHQGTIQQAWRPRLLLSYIQATYLEPDIVVDIGAVYARKQAAIMAYKTQFFDPNNDSNNTFISDQSFLDFVDGRAVNFGKMIGASHGEGFLSERFLGVDNLLELK